MGKKIIFIFLLSTFKISYTQNVLDQYLIKQYFQFSNFNVIVLNDNSIWQLFEINIRKQSWSEWWNKEEIKVDPKFIWKNTDWKQNSKIYFSENIYIDEISKKIQKKDIKNFYLYEFAIENIDSNKIAFVKNFETLELLNFLNKLLEEKYKEGYKDGFEQGCIHEKLKCRENQ